MLFSQPAAALTLVLAALLNMTTSASAFTPLDILYSNDTRGNTEPCG